ncbi:hypothetical protein PIB30_011375 [Stylosanthes scabra]|uniref:Uncharacterized protein n=1 Tax=Stylosanthes scabra TaxID=79078 RepID=A0ABU6Y2H0_9FABA|nr:hypothetical protein [Stylosanthes scabra]
MLNFKCGVFDEKNTHPPPPNPTPLPPPPPSLSLSISLLASLTLEAQFASPTFQRVPRAMSSRGPNGAASACASAVTTPARNRTRAITATLAGYIESSVTKRKRWRKASGVKRTGVRQATNLDEGRRVEADLGSGGD